MPELARRSARCHPGAPATWRRQCRRRGRCPRARGSRRAFARGRISGSASSPPAPPPRPLPPPSPPPRSAELPAPCPDVAYARGNGGLERLAHHGFRRRLSCAPSLNNPAIITYGRAPQASRGRANAPLHSKARPRRGRGDHSPRSRRHRRAGETARDHAGLAASCDATSMCRTPRASRRRGRRLSRSPSPRARRRSFAHATPMSAASGGALHARRHATSRRAPAVRPPAWLGARNTR